MKPDDWHTFYDKSSHMGCNPVELGKAAATRIDRDAKTISYLQQENEVLHERVRKLEIALAAEREACAKVAEEYGDVELAMARANPWNVEIGQEAARKRNAAERIASLIRGRGNADR